MKRFVLFLLAAVCMLNCYSLDVVHLNNGHIIKGTIKHVKEGESLTITSEDGYEYTYPFIEVKTYNLDGGVITPTVDKSKTYQDYNYYNRGFWAAIELDGGYLLNRKDNAGYTELHFIAGYRINEFIKFGAGFGGRFYINNNAVRCENYKWSFPLFLSVRGNIIPELHKDVVPFYSAELGSAINDGLYFRPALGLRIGEPRSAFTIALTYTAQRLKMEPERKATSSFVGLKIGWEF